MSAPSPASLPGAPSLTFGGYAGQPGQLQGVGFWPRAAARLIDFVVHTVTTYCAGFFFGAAIALAALLAQGTGNAAAYTQAAIMKVQSAMFLTFGASLAGATVYEIVCEAGHGSTLGKMLLGITVVREDAGFCGLKAAVIRSLGYYVDSLFFGVIGYFAMQGSVSEQRHGDRWAGTVVCRRSSLKPQQLRGGGRFVAVLVLAVIADAAAFLAALTLALLF